MANTQYGGYMAVGSPSTGGFARKSETAHSLRPLTIHQLHNASQPHPDADWMLDETEIGQVSVVAHIVSVQSQATNSQYMLDDGTARIEARRWIDSSMEENSEKLGVVEGVYVRVLGALKMFGNKRYVNVTHVRPVESPIEIYFHLLEVMFVTLHVTLPSDRGPLARPGQGLSQTLASAYSAPARQATDDSQLSHLPQLHRSIVAFMQGQPPNDTGVHVSAIARVVGGDAPAISDALDKLMDDGLVFSTIDDSHFKLAT